MDTVELFVVTDDGNEVLEKDEDNNRQFSPEIRVSFLPRPDLQAVITESPETVKSGGVIDVSYTIRNFGNAKTPTGGSRWRDEIFITNDPQGKGPHVASLVVNNLSALDPADGTLNRTFAYSNKVTLKIDRQLAGQVYVFVKADVYGEVDEGPVENNNLSKQKPLFVDMTPVPPADLVTADVQVTPEAFDGSTITVRYLVENNGAGVTDPVSWVDAVWLTRGKDRPNPLRGDVLLGSALHSGALKVGDSYQGAISVRLPIHIGGKFNITVWTNPYNGVTEQTRDVKPDGTPNLNPDALDDLDGNNFKAAPLSIFRTPPSDLEVTEFTVPATGRGGDLIRVSWTVSNKGTAKTDRDSWADAIYLSTTPTLDQGEHYLMFAAPHVGVLESKQSYTEFADILLPPSAKGSYLIVKTNADPSLVPTEEESLLQQIQGIIQRAEVRLGKPLIQATSGDIQKLSRNDLINILTGNGTVGFVPVWEDIYTDNNTRTAASAITDIPADLVVTQIEAPSTVFSGEQLTVKYQVRNVGQFAVWGDTQRWRDYVFISDRPDFVPGVAKAAGVVTHVSTQPLKPGDSYQGEISIKLPAGIEGKRYVFVLTAVEVNSRGDAALDGYQQQS